MSVKAVLLDSGGVLIGPKGGRWNPRADFEENLAEHHPDIDPDALAAAIAVGDAWLDTPEAITAPYEEYYRRILGALGIDTTDDLLASLLREREPGYFVETYAEVHDVIVELQRRRFRLAVVSDAWPNLPDLHAAVGLVDCFEVYAISAVLGCTKPDPRMYRHASDGLGLQPAECLFVDNGADLVEAAEEVRPGLTAITDLRALLPLLD